MNQVELIKLFPDKQNWFTHLELNQPVVIESQDDFSLFMNTTSPSDSIVSNVIYLTYRLKCRNYILDYKQINDDQVWFIESNSSLNKISIVKLKIQPYCQDNNLYQTINDHNAIKQACQPYIEYFDKQFVKTYEGKLNFYEQDQCLRVNYKVYETCEQFIEKLKKYFEVKKQNKVTTILITNMLSKAFEINMLMKEHECLDITVTKTSISGIINTRTGLYIIEHDIAFYPLAKYTSLIHQYEEQEKVTYGIIEFYPHLRYDEY